MEDDDYEDDDDDGYYYCCRVNSMCYFGIFQCLSSLFVTFCFIDETCKCYKDGCSGYTFNMISARVNWEKSRQLCQQTERADLVSVESEAEWTFLKNTILNLTIVGEYFIGLKKGVPSREWRWLSSKSVMNESQKRWGKDEPSGDGNCVVMFRNYRRRYGKYNDLNCLTHRRSGYICERPVDSCKGMTYTFYM